MLIEHPTEYTTDLRVLMLTSRNKDGCEEKRTILKISKDSKDFTKKLDELCSMMKSGERVYASLSPRNIKIAIREFKQAQLDAEYDSNPNYFYEHLNSRWSSALMNPKSESKLEKLWLFACDTALAINLCHLYLQDKIHYEYYTKTGVHIITKPFELKNTEIAHLLHRNASMLWAY